MRGREVHVGRERCGEERGRRAVLGSPLGGGSAIEQGKRDDGGWEREGADLQGFVGRGGGSRGGGNDPVAAADDEALTIDARLVERLPDTSL
jgi:hypothetical protein